MKVTWIPVQFIWVRNKKRRSSWAARRLNQSVKEQGIINPISVMKMGTRYLLILGEGRLRAAKKNKMERIPAYVMPRTPL